jgi:hypothetical protein
MRTWTFESLVETRVFRGAATGFLAGIDDHKDFIFSCSPELQCVLWPYVTERQDLESQWRHPNLILPLLLNELFCLENKSVIRTICAAYLACDHFTHLIDDLADENRDSEKAMLAHASHLMLSRGRQLYLENASEPNSFLGFFEAYLKKAMNGEQGLWKRRGNTMVYNEKEIEMLRERGSILNICITAYCDITDQWKIWNKLEIAFGNVVVGIQLLDDVVDVDKDFRNGIYTNPLATVIGEVGHSNITFEYVAERLLLGSGWTNTISLASRFLNDALSQLNTLGALSTCAALSEIISTANALLKDIKEYQTAPNTSPTEKLKSILGQPAIKNLSH